MDVRLGKQTMSARLKLVRLQVVVFMVFTVDVCGVNSHGAVHVNRQLVHLVPADHLAEEIEQLLSAAYGKRWNDDRAPPLCCPFNNLRKARLEVVGGMKPVSVGGFTHQVIHRTRNSRFPDDQLREPANVSGKK